MNFETTILPSSVLIMRSRGTSLINMRKKDRNENVTTAPEFSGEISYWGES